MALLTNLNITKSTFYVDIKKYKDTVTISNSVFHHMQNRNLDGLQITNDMEARSQNLPVSQHIDRTTYVENCYFSNRGCAGDSMDELAAAVRGTEVIFNNCVFDCNGKGVLVGSGEFIDHDIDEEHLNVTFDYCVFRNCSRRNPMVQRGNVLMRNCLVENWGVPETFHEKSFGARASDYGYLEIFRTLFIQRDFFKCINKNIFSDMFRNSFPWHPGFMRGITKDNHGRVDAEQCYKNHWWITLAGHHDSYMSKDEAEELYNYLEVHTIQPCEAIAKKYGLL